MSWIVSLSVVLGTFAFSTGVSVNYDGSCVSWDDRIEQNVFQPLRQKLREFSSEFKDFTGADFDWHGFGVNWQSGTSGNYSAFRLNKIEGKNASSLCDTSDGRVLLANIRYEALGATFKEVELYNPFFSLGNYQPTLIFEGVNIYAYVNATPNASEHCNASLGWFVLGGFDSLQLEMNGGVFGWFAEKIFNWIASPRIAAFLQTYTENQSISSQVKQFLAPAVQAHSRFFCSMLYNETCANLFAIV